MDYFYKSINCQFEVMNEKDVESQFIQRYIWASSPKTQVEQIFKVARPNDDERLLQRILDHHYLIWHGTNICNLISILTRGTVSIWINKIIVSHLVFMTFGCTSMCKKYRLSVWKGST